jgi:hypothetical protein
MDENSEKNAALQIALGFAAFLDTKTIKVFEYDLLAGHSQHINVSASVPVIMQNNFDPQNKPQVTFDIHREIECYKQYRAEQLTSSEQALLGFFESGINCGLYKRWASGHVIAGYDRVVKEGYGAIEKRILERYGQVTVQRKDYLEAFLVTIRAARRYILRYAEAARNQGTRFGIRTNLLH